MSIEYDRALVRNAVKTNELLQSISDELVGVHKVLCQVADNTKRELVVDDGVQDMLMQHPESSVADMNLSCCVSQQVKANASPARYQVGNIRHDQLAPEDLRTTGAFLNQLIIYAKGNWFGLLYNAMITPPRLHTVEQTAAMEFVGEISPAYALGLMHRVGAAERNVDCLRDQLTITQEELAATKNRLFQMGYDDSLPEQ